MTSETSNEPVLYIEPADRDGIPANVFSTIATLIGQAYPEARMGPGRVGGRGFALILPERATAKRVTKKAAKEALVEPDEYEPGVLGWTGDGIRMATPPELSQRLAIVSYLFLSKFPEADNYVEQLMEYTDEETGKHHRLVFSVAWSPEQTPREKHKQAEAERDLLAQAMWDARGALGFDNDGDPGPGASIAGDGYAGFAAHHVREATEARKDHDDGLDEADTELAALKEVLRKIRSWHGNSIDPDECMECDDDATNGYRPCRTAERIDKVLGVTA